MPALSPVKPADTATAAEPDPALFAAVFDPYDVPVPYSTYQVVVWPPGTTLPVTVAVVESTVVVGPVVAEGAEARATPVKTASPSTATPAAANRFQLFDPFAICLPPLDYGGSISRRGARSESAV